MEMDFTAVVVVIISVFVVNVNGIMWKLQPNVQKCLKEELQSDVLVTGDYEVQDAPGQKVDYVVCTVKTTCINCDTRETISHLLLPNHFSLDSG
jgi:hypothetical protein